MTVKWIAPKGKYSIMRFEQTDTTMPYRHSSTNVIIPGVTVPGVRIVAYAGDVPVIGASVAGKHPTTLANIREVMARIIQDAGGDWLGRSEASETAAADGRVARETDPEVTPDAEDRKALRDAYYSRVPHPSNY